MSQHDLSIANQGFPAFRSDLNDALQALGSMQSGTTAPSTTYANMLWYDTTNNIVKMRNEDNDAWISLFTLDQSSDLVSAISAATGTFGALSATGNVTLGDSSSDTATVNAKTTFGSEISAPNTFGFKNRLINSDMRIDQRNAGASGSSNSGYPVDRWSYYTNASGSKGTWQQNAGTVTPPEGFVNYLGFTSTSAYTVGSAELFQIFQAIEGYNVADLDFGKSTAKTITLSFWVRSSLTGTFGASVFNSSIGTSRSYPFTYTISSANTWEQKSVTIAGDTFSQTWNTTNTRGLVVSFGLGAGSTYSGTAGAWATGTFTQPTGTVSVVGTSGATFYITGVQLEKGSTATSFDYRPYGTELALCQRYCQAVSNYSIGVSLYNNIPASTVQLRTTMRASPTLSSGATFAVDGGSAGTPALSATTGGTSNPDSVFVINSASNWAVGNRTSFTGILTAEL